MTARRQLHAKLAPHAQRIHDQPSLAGRRRSTRQSPRQLALRFSHGIRSAQIWPSLELPSADQLRQRRDGLRRGLIGRRAMFAHERGNRVALPVLDRLFQIRSAILVGLELRQPARHVGVGEIVVEQSEFAQHGAQPRPRRSSSYQTLARPMREDHRGHVVVVHRVGRFPRRTKKRLWFRGVTRQVAIRIQRAGVDPLPARLLAPVKESVRRRAKNAVPLDSQA